MIPGCFAHYLTMLVYIGRIDVYAAINPDYNRTVFRAILLLIALPFNVVFLSLCNAIILPY